MIPWREVRCWMSSSGSRECGRRRRSCWRACARRSICSNRLPAIARSWRVFPTRSESGCFRPSRTSTARTASNGGGCRRSSRASERPHACEAIRACSTRPASARFDASRSSTRRTCSRPCPLLMASLPLRRARERTESRSRSPEPGAERREPRTPALLRLQAEVLDHPRLLRSAVPARARR